MESLKENKCSSCEFFEFYSWKKIPQPEGKCNNPKIFSNYHAKKTHKMVVKTPKDGISCNGCDTPEEQRQYIKVGRDFGCIHHSKINHTA